MSDPKIFGPSRPCQKKFPAYVSPARMNLGASRRGPEEFLALGIYGMMNFFAPGIFAPGLESNGRDYFARGNWWNFLASYSARGTWWTNKYFLASRFA